MLSLSDTALRKGIDMSSKSIFNRSYYFPRKRLKLNKIKVKDDGIKIIGTIKIKEKNETNKS